MVIWNDFFLKGPCFQIAQARTEDGEDIYVNKYTVIVMRVIKELCSTLRRELVLVDDGTEASEISK